MAQGVQITLSVKDDGTAVIRRVGGELKSLEETGTSGANKLSSSLGTIREHWLGIAAATAGATIAVRQAWAAAERGAAFEESLGRLNRQMVAFGGNADQIVEELKRVTDGQLSMAEASQIASRGLAIGLDPRQVALFGRAAEALSDVLGTQIPQAYDQLLDSVVTGRSAILGNIGVYVDLQKEAENVAKATGRTVDQITKQERAMIGAKAIADQLPASLDRLGLAAVSEADRLKALETRFTDLTLSADRFVKTLVVGAADLPGVLRDIWKTGFEFTFPEAPPGPMLGPGRRELEAGRAASMAASQAVAAAREVARGNEIVTGSLIVWHTRQDFLNRTLRETTTHLKDLQANARPATEAIDQLSSRLDRLNAEEKQLLGERAGIREESAIALRELLKPVAAVELAPTPELGLQRTETAFGDLVSQAQRSGGRMREVILKEAEALLPELKRQLSDLFPEETVRRELEGFSKTLSDTREAAVDQQLTEVQKQQAIVTEGLSLLERHALGIVDEMQQMFLSIEGLSTNVTGEIQSQFTSMLGTINRAILQLQAAAAIGRIVTVPAFAAVEGGVGFGDTGFGDTGFGDGGFGSGEFFGPGFQHGGRFRIAGVGGPDSQLVSFRGTPGERVTIEPPGRSMARQGVGSLTINVALHGVSLASPGAVARAVRDSVLPELRRLGVV